MLENPELLPKMVAESGAHSTDLEAPESAEHLCEKCRAYAEGWQPTAESLWQKGPSGTGVIHTNLLIISLFLTKTPLLRQREFSSFSFYESLSPAGA